MNTMTTLVLQTVAAALVNQGKKDVAKDTNTTGSDDIQGDVELILGHVLGGLDIDPAHLSDLKSLKSVQQMLQAAADSIGDMIAAKQAEVA